MKKIEFYLVLFLSLALCSCGSTMQLISFDQLEASQVNFPESVKKVAVVNNLSSANSSLSGKEIPVSLVGDGAIAASTLATALADAQYFDQVVLCDSTLSLVDPITSVIPVEKINALAKELDVDLLFTIDSLNISNKLISYGYYGDELSAILRPQIKIYVPERKTPLLTIAKQDTLYWSMGPTVTAPLIIKESSSYVAHRVIPFIVPHWKSVSRSYYDGGNYQMRDAAIFMQEGEWDEAFLLWSTIYKSSKGASRMRAAYNMALYYEIKEDLDKALQMLEEASKLTKPTSIDASFIKFYAIQLQDRMSKLSKLQIQMKRFSDNF